MAATSLHPTIYYTRDRGHWRSLADERVLWADGQRQALLAALEPAWDLTDEVTVLRPVGFRTVSFAPDRSRVRVWWNSHRPGADSVTVGAIVTVVWAAGDWWLSFDQPAMDMRVLDPARDGYVPWGPS